MINKTQLNKFRALIDKNKIFIDGQELVNADDDKKHSMALSMAVLMEYLSLNQDSAFDALTDNSGDNKIDAFYYSDDENELSDLIIIQSKYKKTDGDTQTFNEDEIKLCISNCEKLLKGENFQTTNTNLLKKIEAYRQLLSNNELPPISIKLFFATNGIIHSGHKKLNEVVSAYDNNISSFFVDATEFGHAAQIESGNLMVNLKSNADKTDGIFIIEDDLYSGTVVSCTIQSLMTFFENTGKNQLLNRNVRYHLKNSNVNKEIRTSFIEDPLRFCYLNNGITIICTSYQAHPTGHSVTKMSLVNPNIVNGGQTVATLYQLFSTKFLEHKDQFEKAKILIRVYKTPQDYSIKIARATNSQNPISVVDLRANDIAQGIAKEYLAKLGVGLLTKPGEEITFFDDTISNEYILQVFAALYFDDPAKAKTSKALIFKKYYDRVFNDTISEMTCKQLFRCYQIVKFITKQNDKDKAVIQNAIFAITYSMKKYNSNVLNEDIPDPYIQEHLKSSFTSAYSLILRIIEQKQTELKTKFSLNNLFKGNEIKDLIDLEFEC
jgi:hypothetical protein